MNPLPVAHLQSYQDVSPGGPLVDITSNYLLYAPSSRGQTHFKEFLAYTQLPATALGPRSVKKLHFVKYPLRLQHDEGVAAFQLDESQELLAVVISCKSKPVAVLQFLSFPWVNFHPLTATTQAGVCLDFRDIHTCQVHICGDNVGVLLCGGTTSLIVYDWKTGRTRVEFVPTHRQSITAFSFLTPNIIVTTNLSTRQIELWEILSDYRRLHLAGSFGLPAVQAGITVEGLDCTPLSPEQLLNPHFSPVITFNLTMCKKTPRGSTSYCVVKFVVYLATLFDLAFSDVGPSTSVSNRHFHWSTWGRKTLCFDDSSAIDDCNRGGQYFVSLSDAESTKAYNLSIYDFGRARILKNVQKLQPRFNTPELKDTVVFDGDVYTVPCSALHQAVVRSDRTLVDRDRIFAFKYRSGSDHLSVMMYSFHLPELK